MRQIPLLILFYGLLITSVAVAQKSPLKSTDRTQLEYKQDTLRKLSESLNTDSIQALRMKADSQFTRVLVRSMQIRHSFYFPFDSLVGISKLYAPDSTFRILTWNLSYDDYYHRQRGVIQMRTTDGSLRIFPLRDVSEFVENPLDSARDRMNWIGAVYYNMIRTQHAGTDYYTLFGFDPNGVMSSMKWIEVLHFGPKGEPVFGGPLFSYANDTIPKPTQSRFQLEYKKDARVLVDFITELNLILVDHLISENNDPEHKWTYVPDGDQEGFVWKNGKWVHIDKVFTFKLNDGEAPRDVPLNKNISNR